MSPYANRRYAQDTQVPTERSRGEIEKLLIRGGADQFHSGWQAERAIIAFRMQNRMVRIEIPLPKVGSQTSEKETRRRWRAMLLYVKAKLEAIESNIVSFEDAFMSHIILADGTTVGKFMRPQLETTYKDGKMPKQLPGF